MACPTRSISGIAAKATLVLVNGRLWPEPPLLPLVGGPSALALDGDRIIAVGSDEEIARLGGPETTTLDAQGNSVLPGFNDAHVHFLMGARQRRNVELSAETTVAGVLQRVREFAAGHPERPWVLGRGWFYAVFPGGMPHRDLLDRVVADRPAALEAYDSHTTWINGAALDRLGITDSTPNPPRGEIVRDAFGRATGILKESAMQLVDAALPQPSTGEDAASLATAIRLAHRHGLTSVQEAGTGPEEFAIYEALRQTGGPPIRVRLGMRIEPGASMDEIDRRLAEYEVAVRAYRDNSWVTAGIVKAFADGVIESGTAAMLEPYEGMSPNRPDAHGQPLWDWAELAEAVLLGNRRGWQVQVHAIGDGAVRAALDAFQRSIAANPGQSPRNRVEHIETVAAADIARFGRLGVVASMQPYHADPEPAQLDLYTSKIGRDRASRGWPWASIRRAGGRLAFGSDWPIVSLDPFLGLNAAVNRTTPRGHPQGGWLPGERLALGEALAGYSTGAAWAEHAESTKGALRPGMLADIIILDRDLAAIPSSELVSTKVRTTIVGGQLVYDAAAAEER